jgi:hypothetical protein
VFFSPVEKRCRVVTKKGRMTHDYARLVRLDPKRCGPKGKLFTAKEEEEEEGFVYAS